MQVQQVQNNSYNTQFNGKLTLLTAGKPVQQKELPIDVDRILYNAHLALVGGREDATAFYNGGSPFGGATVSVKKADFTNFIDLIKKYLSIEKPILAIYTDKTISINSNFSSQADGKLAYQIDLSNGYRIEHALNVNDLS